VQHRAYLYLDDSDEIYHALKVEAGREIPRTKIEIRKKDGVEIEIIAEDLHALRAALNSYLRWINLGYEIVEVIKDGGS